MRRYLDPKNIPKTLSQEVFGRLGIVGVAGGLPMPGVRATVGVWHVTSLAAEDVLAGVLGS